MSEENELKDIDIDKLLDEIEDVFKRKTPDERQANEEKFRLEYPELNKELEAIFSEFKTAQATSCLSASTPKDVLLEILVGTSNFHLFGTFSEIQYAAGERPLPLFCFESDEYGLMWGDGAMRSCFTSSIQLGSPRSPLNGVALDFGIAA